MFLSLSSSNKSYMRQTSKYYWLLLNNLLHIYTCTHAEIELMRVPKININKHCFQTELQYTICIFIKINLIIFKCTNCQLYFLKLSQCSRSVGWEGSTEGIPPHTVWYTIIIKLLSNCLASS